MCFASLDTRLARAPGDTFGNSENYILIINQCSFDLYKSMRVGMYKS